MGEPELADPDDILDFPYLRDAQWKGIPGYLHYDANYLLIVSFPDVGELTIFCGALVGASLGFLWWNAHPADVFMGDVGSLALGGALGTVAILIKQELLLPIVGGVFVMEAGSVIIQVGYFKWTRIRLGQGKRFFKMSPLHSHFELLGWSETQVMQRFVLVGMVLLALLKNIREHRAQLTRVIHRAHVTSRVES